LAIALILALTPLGGFAGFLPLSPSLLVAVAGVSLLYLASAEALKRAAISPRR
jgi:Mg2+-importing ATPase